MTSLQGWYQAGFVLPENTTELVREAHRLKVTALGLSIVACVLLAACLYYKAKSDTWEARYHEAHGAKQAYETQLGRAKVIRYLPYTIDPPALPLPKDLKDVLAKSVKEDR